ncbi:MAG: hypothetical protein VX185_09000 [Pseudomonadota bacterium]|nr:hypothetical protein [Pseudomonadota bacterium]
MNYSIAPETQSDAAVLHNLLNLNQNALIFYRAGQKMTPRKEVKDIYHRLEEIHTKCVESIKNQISSLGEKVKAFNHDTFDGQSVNMLNALHAIIASGPGQTLEQKLIQSESRCLQLIKKALNAGDLTDTTSGLLRKQGHAIKGAHEELSKLEAKAM